VAIEISVTAWSSDPRGLPEDTRHALETDGRTELLKVLGDEDPPRVIRCDSAGCTTAQRVAVSMTAMENSASQMIDQRIRELDDWRGSVLKRMRNLIHEADPEVVEEWKWVKESSPGTPVWSHDGGICTGEAYKQVVKLTFFHGASLKDPAQLFNSTLGGNTRRAIDIRENDAIDEAAFKELIRAAVAFNAAKRKK
jgi:hypothetical protein